MILGLTCCPCASTNVQEGNTAFSNPKRTVLRAGKGECKTRNSGVREDRGAENSLRRSDLRPMMRIN